jgi:hypothetical protein
MPEQQCSFTRSTRKDGRKTGKINSGSKTSSRSEAIRNLLKAMRRTPMSPQFFYRKYGCRDLGLSNVVLNMHFDNAKRRHGM